MDNLLMNRLFLSRDLKRVSMKEISVNSREGKRQREGET